MVVITGFDSLIGACKSDGKQKEEMVSLLTLELGFRAYSVFRNIGFNRRRAAKNAIRFVKRGW